MRFLRSCIVFACATPALAGPEILVGSWSTHSVRRYDADTGAYLGDLVPPGGGGLTRPDGLAWGGDGNLYVASALTHKVLRFDGRTGAYIDEFVATGLNDPGNLQFGPDGRLYVCNKGTSQVFVFNGSSGAFEGVFAQGGGMVNPVGLAWANGMLYVSGFNSGGVFEYNALSGAFVRVLTRDVITPLILRIGDSNDIFVSSHQQNSVRRYDLTTGAPLGIITGGGMACPVGHLVAPDGTLIVASWPNHRLLRYDNGTGAFLGTFAIGQGLALPNDLLFRPDTCYADCDSSTGRGVLDIFDFLCFQNRYDANNPYACDCDASTGPGVCDIFDFLCFQNAYDAGCP